MAILSTSVTERSGVTAGDGRGTSKRKIAEVPRLTAQLVKVSPMDNTHETEFYLLKAPRAAAIIYQLTSPRTVQAFLVATFSLAVLALVLQNAPVPDLLGYILASIVGFYFADKENTPPYAGVTPIAPLQSEVTTK